MVRTSPSQGGDRGPIPLGTAGAKASKFICLRGGAKPGAMREFPRLGGEGERREGRLGGNLRQEIDRRGFPLGPHQYKGLRNP